jgi:hypothetical protein
VALWEDRKLEVKMEETTRSIIRFGGAEYDWWNRQTYGKDTLRPVTIKQIIDA